VHLDAEQLVDYFNGVWTQDQQSALEIHLFKCDSCADLAQQICKQNYEMEDWTAASHVIDLVVVKAA
jgi:hypothetical protein